MPFSPRPRLCASSPLHETATRPQPLPTAIDPSAATRTPRFLARGAAAIAAAAAPPAARPRERPAPWANGGPERAPEVRRAPLSPDWWELHAQVWLSLSGRQRKRLTRLAGDEGDERAREEAARVVASQSRETGRRA